MKSIEEEKILLDQKSMGASSALNLLQESSPSYPQPKKNFSNESFALSES